MEIKIVFSVWLVIHYLIKIWCEKNIIGGFRYMVLPNILIKFNHFISYLEPWFSFHAFIVGKNENIAFKVLDEKNVETREWSFEQD